MLFNEPVRESPRTPPSVGVKLTTQEHRGIYPTDVPAESAHFQDAHKKDIQQIF